MTRPDLSHSDLQGLEHNAYGQRTPERRLAPLEEPEELEEPARWELLINAWGPPVAMAILAALCIWIWGRLWT